jgi:glycosyltransferase involved in cell wall biosynthesis
MEIIAQNSNLAILAKILKPWLPIFSYNIVFSELRHSFSKSGRNSTSNGGARLILYILDRYPVLSETFIRREIEVLCERGIQVTILAISADTEATGEKAISLPCPVVRLPRLCSWAGWITCMRGFFVEPSLVPFAFWEFAAAARLGFRFVRQRLLGIIRTAAALRILHTRPSRIHAQFAYVASDLAEPLSRAYGVPWSISVHAWDIFSRPIPEIRRRVRNADRIFVCTEHGLSHLARHIPEISDRLELMRHGIFPEAFTIARGQDDDFDLLSVGRLEEKKGFPDLIRAVAILSERGVNVLCRILGEGAERAKLERLAIEAKVEKRVVFYGTKSNEEVLSAMRSARIFVLSCRIAASGDRDGIPNVILEAMASGLPVVTTNVGGISEAIQDSTNGICVPPESPDQLADAIQSLLENPQERERLIRNALETVRERFDGRRNIEPLAKWFARAGEN